MLLKFVISEFKIFLYVIQAKFSVDLEESRKFKLFIFISCGAWKTMLAGFAV